MNQATIHEINERNGWVICGVEQSFSDTDRFMTGTDKKTQALVSKARVEILKAIKHLREAHDLRMDEGIQ